MSITHSKVSAVSDGGDASVVQPSDWNGAHVVPNNELVAAKLAASATNVLFGRSTAGAGAGEEIALTSAGRALIDDADAAAQRTTLGLGTIATQAANNVTISGGAIAGITALAVADGGTGSGTAAGARTNLGLATVASSGLISDTTGTLALNRGGTGQTTALAAARALNVPFCLGHSFVGVSCPTDTTEDPLAQITIPILLANEGLEIITHWVITSSANNKTLRIRLSGSAGTDYFGTVFTTVSNNRLSFRTYIYNQNNTSAQFGWSEGYQGSGAAGVFLASVNGTTATGAGATTLYISGQKASSGEVITLDGYRVILMSTNS